MAISLPAQTTLNCRGKLLKLQQPVAMGILNLTPDSFSDGGKFNSEESALIQVAKMLEEGASIIDIGGYSSRPGAPDLSVEEELERVLPITQKIRKQFPDAILSTDTFRSVVAAEMLELGVHLVNDISAGMADEKMFATVAWYQAPIILMHMQGTPQTMQLNPQYENIAEEIFKFFTERINAARSARIRDIVLDPGFGFGKTYEQNLELFAKLRKFKVLGLPLMVGMSRKGMVNKFAEISGSAPEEVSVLLHFSALSAGTKILRVHDVEAAVATIELFELGKSQID